MQHFNRERVPERVVHAKGGGAHGFFEVTEDVTPVHEGGVLRSRGKRTPMFARFSTVAGEQGFADTVRDPRGFAIKFYTEEGNYDLVGNNTPVFFVRDPTKFQDFIHSQKRLPDTGLRSNDMQWDFWTLSPESAHQVDDPDVRPRHAAHLAPHERLRQPHLLVDQRGRRAVLGQVPLQDRPGHRELHRRRGQGDDRRGSRLPPPRPARPRSTPATAPEWRLEMQIMPFEEAADYRFNPFDLTKVWPHGDYPPIQVGRMVLDRNPENFFAEVEQAGFSPSNLVPGIGLSPDKMLMGRIFSYHDTHLHRIGTNYEQLPINAPKSPVHSYNKDGAMTYHHAGDQPVYAPNSLRRPGGRPEQRRRPGLVGGRRRARPLRVREARRGRRLRPAGHAVPRGDERHRPRAPRRRTSSATPATTSPPRCS